MSPPIAVGGGPGAGTVAFTPDGKRAYVSNVGERHGVGGRGTATGAVAAPITVGKRSDHGGDHP